MASPGSRSILPRRILASTALQSAFRREAVELVRVSGKPIAQVASDLGVSDQTLRNWVKQVESAEIGAKRRLSALFRLFRLLVPKTEVKSGGGSSRFGEPEIPD